MTSVYLVNIGANMSHKGRARSPIFADGSWVFVSYPTSTPHLSQEYPSHALPFLRGDSPPYTHADPCWDALTYGDDCANPRALALKRVTKGDILLFWGLLWRNVGRVWDGFTGERGWYLFGALRVEEIAVSEQSVQQVSEHNRMRASRNAHFVNGGGHLPQSNRVFLGDPQFSSRFLRAVDLEVTLPSGLIYTAFTSAKGALLSPGGSPSWKSSLRSCRKLWDLNDHAARSRAQIVSDAILKQSNFDLLEGL